MSDIVEQVDEFVKIEFVGGGPADGDCCVVEHEAPDPFYVPMPTANWRWEPPDVPPWCVRRGIYTRIEGRYQTLVGARNSMRYKTQKELLAIFKDTEAQLYEWEGEV